MTRMTPSSLFRWGVVDDCGFPYVERFIGSLRRDCLDHVLIVNESSLRQQIACYLDYYHDSRCHLGLNQDCPNTREVQPHERGGIVRFLKSADSIIATSVVRPNRHESVSKDVAD